MDDAEYENSRDRLFGNILYGRRVLEIISNKWAVLIIFALEKGTKRYVEIQTQKILTQTHHQLERDGLIHREVQPTMPPVVEYTLTPLAETFIPYLRHLNHWINEYYPQIEQARREFDTREKSEEYRSTRTV